MIYLTLLQLVHGPAMYVQTDAKGVLTNEQYELARTLYMQWLHE